MIHIHICEDSEHQLKQIKKALQYACAIVSEQMQVVTATTKPEDIIEKIDGHNKINVYFLDIDLSHKTMNGLDVAIKIREKDPVSYICFVTTHSEMSYLTFKYKVMAFDFIIKETFESLQKDFLNCLKAIEKQVNLLQDNKDEYLELDLFHEKKIIPLAGIIAIETIGNHKIRMYTDTQTIDMSRTLSSIKKELPAEFIKCHRGGIINGKKIISFDFATGKLILEGGIEIYVATRKINEMKNFINSIK